jgi:Ni,Fe-hydrogenase III small subunit
MNLSGLLSRRVGVFHVRLGSCGGCGDLLDVVLRDRFEGRGPLVECDSPRHVRLLVVTGLWGPGVTGPALDVIEQAPVGRKIILIGDCALGRGPLLESLRAGALPEGLKPDLEVPGCPVSIKTICERISDVAR